MTLDFYIQGHPDELERRLPGRAVPRGPDDRDLADGYALNVAPTRANKFLQLMRFLQAAPAVARLADAGGRSHNPPPCGRVLR